MPAVTYLSDHEVKRFRSVPDDKDCDELLQDLRKTTGDDWLVEVRTLPIWRPRWHRMSVKKTGERTYYTLYADCHGEWQIINLVTPDGGSVFNGCGREAVMNFMLGLIAGWHDAKKRLS